MEGVIESVGLLNCPACGKRLQRGSEPDRLVCSGCQTNYRLRIELEPIPAVQRGNLLNAG